MKARRCRGYRDLLPQNIASLRHIEEVFRSSCQRWGYEEVKTPALEYLHLFTSVGTLSPDMLSMVYSFLDWDGWSGERVVLRPEGTIPIARLFVEEGKRFSRLFYVENMFRFEEGEEPREIWQCGVELLGSDRSESLVELILLGREILWRLGFEPSISLSHTDLEVLKDKEFAPLFGEGGRSHGFLANLTSLSLPDRAVRGVDELKDVSLLLDELELSYSIDLPWVENFEYYTGGIFRFSVRGRRVGGGGRYDHLIPLLGGGEVPACGFALYVDPLVSEMKVLPEDKKILISGKDKKSCFEVATRLRDKGYTAILDLGVTCPVEWEMEVEENLLHLVNRKTTKKVSGSLDDIVSGIEDSST